MTGPSVSGYTVDSAVPPGLWALTWHQLPLPNNPTSIAIWTAYDNYPLSTVVTTTLHSPAGALTGILVEAFEYASAVYSVSAPANTAEASSAGGGAPGSGAPSVAINTQGQYPSAVVGVGYDPTSTTAMTPAAGQKVLVQQSDSANHARLWVQSLSSDVTSGAQNPVTLSDTTAANDGWDYGAVEVKAYGNPGFYTGIQPDSYPQNTPNALFSYFGSAAKNIASTCKYDADGGAGVSCSAPINWVVGHTYVNHVSGVVGSLLTKWTATSQDVTANTAPVTIGYWSIPNAIGLLNDNPVGFTELYIAPNNCAQVPYARVINHAPTAVANDAGKTNVTGSVVGADNYGIKNDGTTNCAAAEVVSNSEEISTTGQPRVSPDGMATSTSATSTSATLTPDSPGDLLVASVSTFNEATVSVSGGGLTWTNVLNQHDNVPSDGGLISVWTAREPSTFPTSATTVTSTISGNGGWAQTLNVTAYAGASGIGQTGFANGSAASSPSLTITPQQTGSWVSTAGYDAGSTTTVTPGAGEVLDASAQDNVDLTEMWSQHTTTTTTAGTPVTVGDTLSPAGVWDLGAVEIMPASKVNLVTSTAPQTGSGTVTATVQPVNNAANLTGGDLLVAYVSTTNTAGVSVSSSPALNWVNVTTGSDSSNGDGGLISIWEAEVPNGTSSVAVQSSLSGNPGSWAQTLVVDEFNGASAVGETLFATGPYTSSPSVSVPPTATGSWISAVGYDGDSTTSVTPGTNQVLDASAPDTFENAQMWFQHYTVGTTASQNVVVGDTLSPAGHWDIEGVEIVPQA